MVDGPRQLPEACAGSWREGHTITCDPGCSNRPHSYRRRREASCCSRLFPLSLQPLLGDGARIPMRWRRARMYRETGNAGLPCTPCSIPRQHVAGGCGATRKRKKQAFALEAVIPQPARIVFACGLRESGHGISRQNIQINRGGAFSAESAQRRLMTGCITSRPIPLSPETAPTPPYPACNPHWRPKPRP